MIFTEWAHNASTVVQIILLTMNPEHFYVSIFLQHDYF